MTDDDFVAHPNFISNISETDLKSLEDGQWVTDNVLTLVFNNMQQNVEGHNETFVDPNVTQIFKKSLNLNYCREIIKNLKLTEKD